MVRHCTYPSIIPDPVLHITHSLRLYLTTHLCRLSHHSILFRPSCPEHPPLPPLTLGRCYLALLPLLSVSSLTALRWRKLDSLFPAQTPQPCKPAENTSLLHSIHSISEILYFPCRDMYSKRLARHSPPYIQYDLTVTQRQHHGRIPEV